MLNHYSIFFFYKTPFLYINKLNHVHFSSFITINLAIYSLFKLLFIPKFIFHFQILYISTGISMYLCMYNYMRFRIPRPWQSLPVCWARYLGRSTVYWGLGGCDTCVYISVGVPFPVYWLPGNKQTQT